MFAGKKIIVVMPAYNAAKTLEKTYKELAKDIVDEVIIVDDSSNDNTVEIARRLNLNVVVHEKNMGYGANQKTCYLEALERGADIVIMLHPDYQYPPKLVPALAVMLTSKIFDIALGSRILGGMALRGGMPLYKYVANRFLTFIENLILGAKLSEYHTGYRAFTKEVLTTLPLLENSDDFVFDNEILVQAIYFGFRIGEITAPSKYHDEASTINFIRSVAYGFGVLKTILKFLVQKAGVLRFQLFNPAGKKLRV
jgi:glycosyltransferase involved in cell wall biosynthesis